MNLVSRRLGEHRRPGLSVVLSLLLGILVHLVAGVPEPEHHDDAADDAHWTLGGLASFVRRRTGDLLCRRYGALGPLQDLVRDVVVERGLGVEKQLLVGEVTRPERSVGRGFGEVLLGVVRDVGLGSGRAEVRDEFGDGLLELRIVEVCPPSPSSYCWRPSERQRATSHNRESVRIGLGRLRRACC